MPAPNHQQEVFALIKAMAGQANIVAVPRLFIEYCGQRHDWAAMLSQLLYWSDRASDSEGWFCKTDGELETEIGISRYNASACRAVLKERGFITTKIAKVSGTPKLHYRFDQAVFVDCLTRFIDAKGEPLKPSSTDLYFEAVADACKLRPSDNDWSRLPKTTRGLIAKVAKEFRDAGTLPDDITTARADWDANDFRGQRGNAPAPMQLLQHYALMSGQGTPAKSNGNGRASNPMLDAIARAQGELPYGDN